MPILQPQFFSKPCLEFTHLHGDQIFDLGGRRCQSHYAPAFAEIGHNIRGKDFPATVDAGLRNAGQRQSCRSLKTMTCIDLNTLWHLRSECVIFIQLIHKWQFVRADIKFTVEFLQDAADILFMISNQTLTPR
jgi:hypothetical protein